MRRWPRTGNGRDDSWGFRLQDDRHKSTKQLVTYLARAAGMNANFLLNVGPMPKGRIQPEFETRLREIGAWMQRYGESIYGTRGGPVAPRPWGVTTRKGSTVYVHILDWPASDALWVPLRERVVSARYLADGSPASFTTGQDGILLGPVPERARDANDTVIAIDIAP